MEEMLYFNGINGTTGGYGLEISPTVLEKIIRNDTNYNEVQKFLEQYGELIKGTENNPTRGVKEGVDANKLAETGWGIIFAENDSQVPQIQEALSELLSLRRAHADEYFRIFAGEDGYRVGDDKRKFLARHGVAAGPVDPKKGVPYYLLIVGSPEFIPYSFQYQLDVQFAVGRIYFDTLDEYAAYARSIATAESGKMKIPRRVSLFGVANPDDKATKLSADYLVQPLYKSITETVAQKNSAWEVNLFKGDEASKANLARLLGGDQTPALLFTASHGLEFPKSDARQVAQQGALLCADWPGPIDHRGPIKQDWYFAGDDVARDAQLLGLMTFHFACYGAGTPLQDDFTRQARQQSNIAERPFIAQLPKKLLGHAKGGALAAIGHVERAWGYSFYWAGMGEQITVFESSIRRLMEGQTVGSALEYFNQRYAELATDLNELIDNLDAGKKCDPSDLTGLWTANNDARNYIIVGDPAARLPVSDIGEAVQTRPVINLNTTPSESGGTLRLAEIPVSFATTATETASTKPIASISDEDWDKTPPAVQNFLLKMVNALKLAKGQLDALDIS